MNKYQKGKFEEKITEMYPEAAPRIIEVLEEALDARPSIAVGDRVTVKVWGTVFPAVVCQVSKTGAAAQYALVRWGRNLMMTGYTASTPTPRDTVEDVDRRLVRGDRPSYTMGANWRGAAERLRTEIGEVRDEH